MASMPGSSPTGANRGTGSLSLQSLADSRAQKLAAENRAQAAALSAGTQPAAGAAAGPSAGPSAGTKRGPSLGPSTIAGTQPSALSTIASTASMKAPTANAKAPSPGTAPAPSPLMKATGAAPGAGAIGNVSAYPLPTTMANMRQMQAGSVSNLGSANVPQALSARGTSTITPVYPKAEPGTPLTAVSGAPWGNARSVPVMTGQLRGLPGTQMAGGQAAMASTPQLGLNSAASVSGASAFSVQTLAPGTTAMSTMASTPQLGSASVLSSAQIPAPIPVSPYTSSLATPGSAVAYTALSQPGTVIRKTSSPVRKKTSKTVSTGTAKRNKDDASEMMSIQGSVMTPPTPLEGDIKQSILQEAAEAVQSAREKEEANRDIDDEDAFTDYSQNYARKDPNKEENGSTSGGKKKIVHLGQLKGSSGINRGVSPNLRCRPSNQSVGSPSVSRQPSAPPTPKVTGGSQFSASNSRMASYSQPPTPKIVQASSTLPTQLMPGTAALMQPSAYPTAFSQPGTPLLQPGTPIGASPRMLVRTLYDMEPRSPTMSVISGYSGRSGYDDVMSVASAPVGGKMGSRRKSSQKRKINIGAARYSGQMDKNRIAEEEDAPKEDAS